MFIDCQNWQVANAEALKAGAKKCDNFTWDKTDTIIWLSNSRWMIALESSNRLIIAVQNVCFIFAVSSIDFAQWLDICIKIR